MQARHLDAWMALHPVLRVQRPAQGAGPAVQGKDNHSAQTRGAYARATIGISARQEQTPSPSKH
eukprot:scaffold14669_cov152-Isochrysis_galbana.AAC.2